jgi:hypothetical protein
MHTCWWVGLAPSLVVEIQLFSIACARGLLSLSDVFRPEIRVSLRMVMGSSCTGAEAITAREMSRNT